MPRPVVALVGATASGKTGLSLDLAERLGGEVVNTDAMQVYRGMDVGTAKLPGRSAAGSRTTCSTSRGHRAGDRRAVPGLGARRDRRHPRPRRDARCWSAARRSTPARSSTASSSPAPTTSVRRELEVELERVGSHALHQRLAGVDPEAAAQILPDNGRRVVRALEVVALTGRPYSASLPRLEYVDPLTVQVGVDIDRRRSTRGSPGGSRRCSLPGSSRRSRRCSPAASPTRAPRRGPSATGR